MSGTAYTDAMSEAQLQTAVIDTAQLLGWLVAHFRPARVGTGANQRWVTPVAADGKGFPDLVLVHPTRGTTLFVELKSKKGRVDDDQARWLDTLTSATATATVWRPAQWIDGTIERTLRTGTINPEDLWAAQRS